MKKIVEYRIRFLTVWLLMFFFLMTNAQIRHIGDVIVNPDGSRGMVFYMHPDGSGGWMVSLHDSIKQSWGTCSDIPNLTNYRVDHFQELLSDMDGYANTQIIRNYQDSDTLVHAAFMVDFENGWYLPAAGQLFILFAALPFIETPMLRAGGSPIYGKWYWTSTEKNTEAAWRMNYRTCNSIGKNKYAFVRAIRNFTVQDSVIDSSLSYLWNTGDTATRIDISPESTTTYSVTATTGFGCSISTDQPLVVIAPVPLTIYDTICEGDTYAAYGFYIDTSETIDEQEIIREKTVQNVYGCDSMVTLNLFLVDTSLNIVSTLGDFCDEFYTELIANTTFTDFVWSTGETNSSIEVNLPGIYSVTASGNLCSATAELVIKDCDFELYLPNTITPAHADGLNDYFGILERQQAQLVDFEIYIFNRWGEQVFQSYDKNFKWYGEFQGRVFHNAVYNYIIRCTTWTGRKHLFKGGIVVL